MLARACALALLAAVSCHRPTSAASAPAAPPDDVGLYLTATELAGRGDAAGALEALRRLDADVWAIPLDPRDFPALSGTDPWRTIAAHIAARAPVTPRAPVAITLAEPGLFAEGIAADRRDGALFVGSIRARKIVRVGADGAVRDLVASGAGGLGRVLGLEVDAARDLLWAAANERASAAGPARSGLFAFDLATGAPRRLAILAEPGHFLNDVAVAEDGTAFVTDSEAGAVHRLAPGAAALARVDTGGKRFVYANGIAFAEGRLLVADALGLWDVPVAGGAPRRLEGPPGFPLGGIDGLDADGRTLVAVQNGLGTARVVRLTLAPAAARVERAEVLEAGNPEWRVPTTGALVGGAYVYIGNSHVDGWTEDGPRPEGMEPTRLHRLALP